MEVSVSFTGEDDVFDPSAYVTDSSPVGKVYIPVEGVVITGPVRIRYEKHPWIERFEIDGVAAAPARRTGIGTKDAKGFVQSLSTIYSPAYEEYRLYGGGGVFDASGYFAHAAEYFASLAGDVRMDKLFRKFCGFTENMWREGNHEMLTVAMEIILPLLRANPLAWSEFLESVTSEFLDYAEKNAQ